MIDIHSHILPDIDDGVENIKKSLEIAREAERQGITGIVATPHYREGRYLSTPGLVQEKIQELKAALAENDIKLDLYPGVEAYISQDLPRKMEEGEILTINNSRYFLLEFPPDIVPEYTVNVLYSLKVMGYKPIIVHPERYEPVQANPDLLYYWIEDGFLAQVNASSLLGVFGSDVEKIAVKLVKNNLVQFIGSDLHGTGRRDQCLGRGLNKLKRLTGPYAEQYLENAAAVINDEELNFMDPEKIKQSWFMGKIRSLLM